VGGIPEQIMDGQTGYLVPAGDADAMAQIILKLVDDKDLCGVLGKNAAKDARVRFGMDLMVKNYLECYYEILDHIKYPVSD
jgi:glycosyltransferase involved in cell wall biosynthesis